MKKIIKILLTTASIAIVGFLILNEKFMFFSYINTEKFESENVKTTVFQLNKDSESLRIASCPSFHHLLEKLTEEDNITTIKTGSTGESLKLLENKEVDFVISGRALKKNEPKVNYKILGHGYDFLFEQEIIVMEDEIPFVKFYTDLPTEEITKDFPQIRKETLTTVNNIEDYLDKGIVITKLENKMIGEVAHIMKETGRRVPLSRLPRLYYSPEITNIFNENELFKLLTQ